jgi:uncharacterized protein (TIGR00251 family)
MPTPWPCLAATADGRCLLTVAVIPNARRTEAVGLHDGALRVRLAAPPLEGRANDELVAWLARALGVQRRAIEIRHGASGRRKRLLLGCELAVVAAWLDGLGIAPEDSDVG